ncbi:MAG TPA: hypothetical protein DEP87_01155 [Candidatus Pacebacteria bacterium]|nr:hypothetical protein [Candidatus Paceibacterota bacterium]
MSRVGHKNPLVLLFLLMAFLVSGLVTYLSATVKTQKTTVLKLTATTVPTPIPTTAATVKAATLSQTSPDGQATLILKTQKKSSSQTEYTLMVTNDGNSTEKLIFSTTLSSEATIEIPFNTWSPDKKYFFILQKSPDSQEYLVFKASGEKFKTSPAIKADNPASDSSGVIPNTLETTGSFVNLTNLYLQAKIPFRLDDTTGWAAPYLLIIKTKETETNVEGPSYWFDVSQQKFIRLSTRF